MFKIRKILNVLLRPAVRVLRNGPTLRRMEASGDPSVRALGRAAGKRIARDPRVAASVDLYRVGLCLVTRRPAAEAERHTLALD